jgi:hypothetical protein
MTIAFDLLSIAASGLGLYYLSHVRKNADVIDNLEMIVVSVLLLIIAVLALAAAYVGMLK